MFASVEFQHRSARSPQIATDVFERASLSILRRYQRAATTVDSARPGDASTAPTSQAQAPVPEPARPSKERTPSQ